MGINEALHKAQDFCKDCKHVFKIRYEPCFNEYTCDFYNIENETKKSGPTVRGPDLARIIMKSVSYQIVKNKYKTKKVD